MSDNVIKLNLKTPSAEEKEVKIPGKIFPTKEKIIEKKKALTPMEEALAHLEEIDKIRRSKIPLLYSSSNPTKQMTAIGEILEALNDYIDMLRGDLISVVKHLEEHNVAAFSSQLHLEAIVNVLMNKGILVDEEFKMEFEKSHAAAMKRLGEKT